MSFYSCQVKNETGGAGDPRNRPGGAPYLGRPKIPCGTFCQSAKNRSSPTSVRGGLTSCSRTSGGTVTTWAPTRAASTTWRGGRVLAGKTWGAGVDVLLMAA